MSDIPTTVEGITEELKIVEANWADAQSRGGTAYTTYVAAESEKESFALRREQLRNALVELMTV